VNQAIQLDARKSVDIDGDPITYAWDFNRDGVFDDATGPTPTFTTSTPGTWVIAVKVTDHPDQNATPYSAPPSSVVAYTTVAVGAHAPVADVGGPYAALPGSTLSLDASGSYDVDGLPLTYAWDFGSGNFTDGTGVKTDFTVPVQAVPGTTYTVCVRASNAARSSTACTTVTVVAPLKAPVITLTASTIVVAPSTSAIPVQLDASRSYDGNGNNGPLSFAWSSTDGGSFTNATSAITTYLVPAHAAPGSSFSACVEVAVVGVSANPTAASCAIITVAPDSLAPVLTVPGSFSAEATGPTGAVVSFSASALDVVDGAVAVTCTPSSGSVLPLGSTTVTCSATDAASNAASASFSVFVVDTTQPTVTVPGPLTVEATGPSGDVATYSASALDSVDGSLPATCDHASGSTFALGTQVVHCIATDSHSNTGVSSFAVTVKDTTQPVVTVPSPVTLEATGSSGAVATYSAMALDSVDGSLPATCDHASGSTFALGTQVVHCVATDSHGNTGSASFDVTVRDTTAPTMTSVSTVVVPATSPAGAVATFTAPTATDLVDGTRPVRCDRTSGSTFTLGTTTVHCSANDTRGNTATAAFDVRVEGVGAQLAGLLASVPDGRRLAPLRAAIVRAIAVASGPRPSGTCGALANVADELREAAGHGLSRGVVLSMLADLSRIRAGLGCRRA
jgi:hypothetical protein